MSHTFDDTFGMNVGSGQGIYKGNIHGETILLRSLVTGINTTLVSGNFEITISGSDSHISGVLQPTLYGNRVSWMAANGYNGATSSFDYSTVITGNLAGRVLTDVDFTSMQRRVGYQTGPDLNANAGFRLIQTRVLGGFTSGSILLGGYHFSTRFNVPDYTTTSRAAVGLFATGSGIGTSSILVGDHQTWTNYIAMTYNLGSASWSISHKTSGSAGSVTSIDLGGDFPVNQNNTYEFHLYSPPGGLDRVAYLVKNLNTNALAKGVLTSDLPLSGTFLAPQVWINNGSSSTDIVGIDVHSQYLRTF